ncbi:hypothetical protein LSH36_233g09090 [Paralvinella palmiformis]|uniref:Transmembrane protein n=1 Tax=Paralvinella palmiformis TaxID=53620 RepID=A0AAD9JPH4_9ANNE|nr:hypothetical protein LSH36_233g09090 [Paralvinella palmiformis]
MAVDIAMENTKWETDSRRLRKITIFAIFWTLILSMFAVAGSVFLYICLKFNLGVCGDLDLFEGPEDLYVPVGSKFSFQEIFLLCLASAYFIWIPCTITLSVGVAKNRTALYIPWLTWSGLMAALCVFGVIHLLTSVYDICIYVLAEYLLAAITLITTIPLSFAVYARFFALTKAMKGIILR